MVPVAYLCSPAGSPGTLKNTPHNEATGGEKGNKDPSPRAAAPWQTSLTLKGFGVFEKFKMSGFLMQSLPIFFHLYLVVST